MKKLLFVALISVISGFAMKAEKVVLKGDTHNALGKYVIEKTDDFVELIVLGDNLNMQYTCEESYFGVAKLDKKYTKAGIKSNSDKLNRTEYFHQKVITQSNPLDRDCLGLIACYYPMLVDNYEKEFSLK